MKCIKCGAEVQTEFKICPYCGEPVQMVPDYSALDENDINVLLEETKDVKSINNKAYMKEQKAKQQQDKKKAIAKAKRKKEKTMKMLIFSACVGIIAIIIIAIAAVNIGNANSYGHQMKQAAGAIFKGNTKDAEKYYLKALKIKPDDLRARVELAEVYIAKGEDADAIELLEEVISKDNSYLDAYKQLYKIYSNKDDVDAILKLAEGVTDKKILAVFSEYVVEAPTLNVESGTYPHALELMVLSKNNLDIFYTVDGFDPRTNGEEYSGMIKLSEAGTHTVKVVAKNEAGYFSEVVSEEYEIDFEAPDMPVVNPDGGTFYNTTYVYISVPEGCVAYYTWDRTDPTINSNVYTTPLLVPNGYNILSVIVMNEDSGLQSEVYRSAFECIK